MKKKITFQISKKNDFSNWYSEIISKAEICDMRYGVKGFVVIQSWGARILEKIYKLFESELKLKNHEPSFFPAVIPEKNFKKESSHVEGFSPEVFWLENKQGEERIALRPTSETAYYEMYKLWIRSYRDLPWKMYQRATVFRYETKATRPLIRGREFWWCEAHNCFATKEEADAQVLEDIQITTKVMHEILGIPFLPIKRPEWDKFPGAEYTVGSDTLMPDGKIIQQPSTHMLGQNFSKAFDVKFVDEDEKEKHVWTTCYGPAMSRIMASVISTHGDDNGLVLPYAVSPYQVVIIPIFDKEKQEEIQKLAEKLKADLMEKGIEARVDNKDVQPGEKYYFWEMKGVPFRAEIGARELEQGMITVFVRDVKKRESVGVDNFVEKIQEMGAEYDKRLKQKADTVFNESIVDCEGKDVSAIKDVLDSGRIARFGFCSINSEGEGCAETFEKKFDSTIRGTLADKQEKPSGNCPLCNKSAEVVIYAGRSY